MRNWFIPSAVSYIFLDIILTTNGYNIDSCGGVIQNQRSIISYKTGEYYSPNERCVWTITNEHYEAISMRIIEQDFADAEDYLELYYLEDGKYRQGIIKKAPWVHIPTCNGNKLSRTGDFCRLDSPIFYIVFRSNGTNQGRGFKFEIDFAGFFYPKYTNYFEGVNITGDTGFVDYKQKDFAGYRETKLSWTIVLSPLVTHTEITLFKFYLNKYYGNNKSSCADYLKIFQLNPGGPQFLGTSCEIPNSVSFQTNSSEPIVVLFQNIIYEKEIQYIQFFWNMKPEALPASFSGCEDINILNLTALVALLMVITMTNI